MTRQEYEREKYYNNPKYIIDRKIRTFFKDVIKKGIKHSKYEKILGYTIQQFRRYIESKFESWMNWNNYGEWEIDHIFPKYLFKYNSMGSETFKDCFSLNNLRPLCKIKNNRRKRKYMTNFAKKSL